MGNVLEIIKGSKLRVSNNCIYVDIDEVCRTIPVNEIDVILIENPQVSVTASVNLLCADNDIPIIFCNQKHEPSAHSCSMSKYYRQTSRINEQISWTSSRKRKLFYKIIHTKIENQIKLLEFFDKTSNISRLSIYLNDLNSENIEQTESICARIYFKDLLGKQFYRGDSNELNDALNYGYAILRSVIKQMIVAKGLEPCLGIWHHSMFNNFNLADDIIEVYRPMVDYVVYLLIIEDGELSRDERELLVKVIYQEVLVGSNNVSFKKSIELFINQIIKYMNKEIDTIDIPQVRGEFYEY